MSVRTSGSSVTVATPLYARGARRGIVPAIGVALSLGVAASYWFAGHNAAVALLFVVLAASGAYLVAALLGGRAIATLRPDGVTVSERPGLSSARSGTPAAIAYGSVAFVTRYGRASTYPVFARFAGSTPMRIVNDAGDIATAARLAREIAGALGLSVEDAVPRLAPRDAVRLIALVTTLTLAPVAGLLILLFFVAMHPAHQRATSELPVGESHAALRAPRVLGTPVRYGP